MQTPLEPCPTKSSVSMTTVVTALGFIWAHKLGSINSESVDVLCMRKKTTLF